MIQDLTPESFLEKMILLWVDKRCSRIIKDNELEYLLKEDCYNNPSGKTCHKEKHMEKRERFWWNFERCKSE